VHADLTTNTAIASPLLSRFDVVLVLRDTASKAWDTQVSTFLLKQAVKGGGGGSASNASTTTTSPAEHWSVKKLRQYIAYVKHSVHPVVTPEARTLLVSVWFSAALCHLELCLVLLIWCVQYIPCVVKISM